MDSDLDLYRDILEVASIIGFLIVFVRSLPGMISNHSKKEDENVSS